MSPEGAELMQMVITPAPVEAVDALLAQPGWEGAIAYASVTGQPRTLVIRGLPEDADLAAAGIALAGLRAAEPSMAANVYRRILLAPDDGGRFFTGGPLSIVLIDMLPEREEAMNAWYDTSHVPNLLEVPGYRVASRFRVVEPRATSMSTGPAYLALYELDDEAAIPLIGPDPEHMTPAAIAELEVFKRDWASSVTTLAWTVFRPRRAAVDAARGR